MAILFIALVIVINWTIASLQIKGHGGTSMRVLAVILWLVVIAFFSFRELDPLHMSWIFSILFFAEVYYLKHMKKKSDIFKRDKIRYIKSSRKD